ncbi:hypothetical protein C8J57DRAFT_1240039 [Mycena rebaudengoi]|nr:hypothetical protein C8J57DRAFT_1240039 [Mycena rebaudengoi]
MSQVQKQLEATLNSAPMHIALARGPAATKPPLSPPESRQHEGSADDCCEASHAPLPRFTPPLTPTAVRPLRPAHAVPRRRLPAHLVLPPQRALHPVLQLLPALQRQCLRTIAIQLAPRTRTARPTAAPGKKALGWGAPAALVIIAPAVVVPVYFLVIKHNDEVAPKDTKGAAQNDKGNDDRAKPMNALLAGADGSTATNGTSFVYKNSFGGYWASSSTNPFLSASRANSWTPSLNESWDWTRDKVHGVNLGGWFVLEPCRITRCGARYVWRDAWLAYSHSPLRSMRGVLEPSVSLPTHSVVTPYPACAPVIRSTYAARWAVLVHLLRQTGWILTGGMLA